MKNSFSVVVAMLCFLSTLVFGQEPDQPGKKTTGITIGLFGSYLNNDLKIRSVEHRSIWEDHDYGTKKLTDEEIDSFNSSTDINKKARTVFIKAGLPVIRPGEKEKLRLDVNLLFGITGRDFIMENTDLNTSELKTSSDPLHAWTGAGVTLDYSLGDNWDIIVNPEAFFSWGKTDNVDDIWYPDMEVFTESREDRSSLWYVRANFYASYSFPGFRIMAGPGIYRMFYSHDYKVTRKDNNDGTVYIDRSIIDYTSTGIIDMGIAMNWFISKAIRLDISSSIGADLLVQAGINYELSSNK